MGFLGKLGSALKLPFSTISEAVAKEVDDKARVGTRSVLLQLDKDLPIVTDLLAGRQVKLEISIRLIENPEDTH